MFEQTYPNQPMMGGYNYAGVQQPNSMVKFNNPLTADQIKRLQAKESQFSLGLTEEEQLRGICNHRNIEGTADTLSYDPITGEAVCQICGYKFKPIEPDVTLDVIQEDVDRIVDILQTVKLMYIDLPADAAREYFQIIPLIEKIPQLFKFAGTNMSKHEMNNWNYSNRNMGAVAMFNNLTSMFGGMNNMAYQQPQMNYNTAPAGFPNAAYAQPNAFGYPGASTYVPGTNPAFSYVPNQAAPTPTAPAATPVATAPTAPAASDATVTQTVSI